MSQEQPTNSVKDFFSNRVVIILLVIAAIGLIIACVFGLLLAREMISTEILPTPFPTSQVQATPDEPIVVAISDSSTLTMTLDAPALLSFKGKSFPVAAQAIPADGTWNPVPLDDKTSIWLYGTIINYVVAVPYSEDIQTTIQQMVLGDEIKLTTLRGTTIPFSFSDRSNIPLANRDIFAQQTPGITIVLLGNPASPVGDRIVIHGDYIVPQPETDSQSSGFQLGEPATLADLQLTVTGATYAPDKPGISPGFAFYLVDYQIQNTSLTAFDTSKLQMLLLDTQGNQYAFNVTASQSGAFPPITGFVNASQTMQATIGYQIPIGLISPSLTWIVANSETGDQINVLLPFSAGSNSSAGSVISLQSATVSTDLANLVLTGSVTNIGQQPIVIGEENVTLRTDEGSVFLLLATNPAFPWSVAPGQILQFSVTFQRPSTATTAEFTVLNQSFQLSNLR